MRQITEKITRAFERRESLSIDNSRTDGNSLWLFENRIAEWREDGLWVTNAEWTSQTTKERLNGLTGVNISNKRGVWFLNGREWNGHWVNVSDWSDGIEHAQGVSEEDEFDMSSEWLEDLRCSRPIYSVYHTTKSWNLALFELILGEANILFRRAESDTVGVYKPNYFLVVHAVDYDRAKEILNQNK